MTETIIKARYTGLTITYKNSFYVEYNDLRYIYIRCCIVLAIRALVTGGGCRVQRAGEMLRRDVQSVPALPRHQQAR